MLTTENHIDDQAAAIATLELHVETLEATVTEELITTRGQADCIEELKHDLREYMAIANEQAAEIERLTAARDELRDVLLRNGFVPCGIPACNCGSWHHRYGLPERMQEIKDALAEADHELSNANGNLTLNALKALVAERDELRRQLAEAEQDSAAARADRMKEHSMPPDELRALADALEPMARAPRFEDFDVPGFCAWLRACADEKPVGVYVHRPAELRYGVEWLVGDPMPDGTQLFTRPAPAAPRAEPKRELLSDDEILDIATAAGLRFSMYSDDVETRAAIKRLARAVERAHGIGGSDAE